MEAELITGLTGYLALVAKLKGTGGRPSVEQFLLDHGKTYTANEKTFEGPRGKAGYCFMNATHEALGGDRLYVEGYVMSYGIPIEHAWTVDASGQIYDPTLKPGDRIGEYHGVAFNDVYLLKAAQANGYYGLLGLRSKSRQALIEGKVTNFKGE